MDDNSKQKDFEPWKILDQKMLFAARPWLEVWQERVRLPNGRIVPDYYKLVVPDVAVVVAVTSEEKVLALRQYKHGVGGTVWELPAGFCNENEPLLDCGRRELLEETGCEAKRWINLGNYVRDANRGGGSVSVFLALDAEKVAEPGSDDLEEYQVHYLTMPELLRLIRNQEVQAVGIVAAILLAHLYFDTHCVVS